MPIEIGLQSSQQDSFEHHEELSKLLTETDVFYVPLRHDPNEANLNPTGGEVDELTKRFDEDLSNQHLIVTFRDIGYSLFLDSVQRYPDETDRSKVRVSGKMIVDGICIQFLGCFDCRPPTQQINGVGRVELDENYYRELSSTHVSSENRKEEIVVPPLIMSKTSRSHTTKTKERSSSGKKPLTRSRTFSETTPPKSTVSAAPTTTKDPIFNVDTAISSIADYSRLISPFPPAPPSSIPIAIPSATGTLPTGVTAAAFLPYNQSQSLPTYVVPAHGLTYIPNPHSTDFSSIHPTNPALLLIANPTHQPVHIYTPLDYRSISVSPATAFRPCNILPSKRPDHDVNPSPLPSTPTNSNPNDQLPLKKRRYTGETSRMNNSMD